MEQLSEAFHNCSIATQRRMTSLPLTLIMQKSNYACNTLAFKSAWILCAGQYGHYCHFHTAGSGSGAESF